MKKRFLVISKEKLYAYIVSVFTILTLFLMSQILDSDLIETEATSSNNIKDNLIIENNTIKDMKDNTSIVNNVKN